MTFFVGDLDPPTAETRGLWQRLTNLGYYDESVDVSGDGVTERHCHVIREFQRSFGLEASGQFDQDTVIKIRDIYESSDTERGFRPARGACLMRNDGPLERAVAPTRHNTIRIPSRLESMGVSGAGIFFRLIRSGSGGRHIYNPLNEIVPAFDFVMVPFINKNRDRLNRRAADARQPSDDDYCRELISNGVTVVGWDWLPNPSNWRDNLEEAIAHTAEIGGRGWVVDAEVEWKNSAALNPRWHAIAWAEAERYVEYARGLCRQHGLWFGFTSFPGVVVHHQLPYAAFVAGTDMSVPQTYDKDHNYNPEYFRTSSEGYLGFGAKAILAGSGAFEEIPNPAWRPPGARPPGYNTRTKHFLHPWRTREQYERHLGTMPNFADSVVCWVPTGHIPAEIRELLVQWRDRSADESPAVWRSGA